MFFCDTQHTASHYLLRKFQSQVQYSAQPPPQQLQQQLQRQPLQMVSRQYGF